MTSKGTGVEMTRDEIAKWLRIHLTEKIGARTFAKLLAYFGDIDHVIGATVAQLAQVNGIGIRTAEQIARGRDEVNAEEELDLAEKLGIDIITIASPHYPPPLTEIADPPHVLYVKGTLVREDNLALAVVGSRQCSQYGREQASRLSHLMAASGFTIVSGLARGIDTAAHQGALSAQGRTLAVQGCGLAQIYPPENAALAEDIAASGALISELPLRFVPMSGSFPNRNRIIAGLSLATLVVEARKNSGALITANLAVEQNRDVMAVPGRIDAPGASGPHHLIKQGAQLVENVEDIIDALGQVAHPLRDHAHTESAAAEARTEATLFDVTQLKLTDPEAAVLACLSTEPMHIDHVVTSTALNAAQANAAVTGLQLKGIIRQLPGSFYQRRSN